jgi:hypothetical protein
VLNQHGSDVIATITSSKMQRRVSILWHSSMPIKLKEGRSEPGVANQTLDRAPTAAPCLISSATTSCLP